MEDNPTWLLVVAAALIDDGGNVLMHRRPEGKPHAGLWEFPGGKVEADEFPSDALAREIYEELGICIDTASLRPAGFAQTAVGEGDSTIVILLYSTRNWEGQPCAQEGGLCQWFSLEEACALAKPALDERLLQALPHHLAD